MEVKAEKSQPGDGKIILPILQGLAVPETSEPKLGEPLIDVPSRVVPIVAAFVPERPAVEQVPVSNAAAPEKTNQFTTNNSVKLRLTEPAISPVGLPAIPEPDRVQPIQDNGAGPPVRRGNLTFVPWGSIWSACRSFGW